MEINKTIAKREFLSYLIVGTLTALIYFGLIVLCINIFNLDYRLGVSIAYFFSVSFHFIANRKYTFHSEGNPVLKQGLRYLAVFIINYLITIAIVFVLVDSLRISTYLSAAISIAVTVGVGYGASKFFVFKNKGPLRD